MSQSLGNCPLCNKPLKNSDDVVTCPECGAPYHRACYLKAGQCIFADKHGSGFEYKSPQQEKAEAAGREQAGPASGMLCKSCGTVNDARNIFCEKCGAPLHAPAPSAASPGGGVCGVWPPKGAAAPGPGMGPGGAGPWLAAQAPPVDTTGELDGIPKKDWATYIGRSSPLYLLRLSQMAQRNNKISFMFSAFLLGPFYFAFRKMWGWAALALAASLLLQVPYYMWAMTVFELPPVPVEWNGMLDAISNVCIGLDMIVRLATGAFALHLFRVQAGKKMKALRQQHTAEADYQAAIAHKGGTSITGILAVVALHIAFALLLYQLAGPAMLQIANAWLAAMGLGGFT